MAVVQTGELQRMGNWLHSHLRLNWMPLPSLVFYALQRSTVSVTVHFDCQLQCHPGGIPGCAHQVVSRENPVGGLSTLIVVGVIS